MDSTVEHGRLRRADERTEAWRAWDPYVSERAWGTVREDYSEHGEAWDHFPHNHARSRVYRWNEDGMAGVCDEQQTWCFALALWNGVDPILKERTGCSSSRPSPTAGAARTTRAGNGCGSSCAAPDAGV